jgi:inner membrane protein
MELVWWHWIVIGFVLVGAEMALPAFYLIWFGLGALLLGLLLLIVPLGTTGQMLIWTLTSTAMVLLWFRYLKPRTMSLAGTSAQIVGEIGLLTRAVAPYERGEVRFQKPLAGAESWACIADEAIAAGERVRVASVEGSILKVSPAKKG